MFLPQQLLGLLKLLGLCQVLIELDCVQFVAEDRLPSSLVKQLANTVCQSVD